jgi:hypothetical protein
MPLLLVPPAVAAVLALATLSPAEERRSAGPTLVAGLTHPERVITIDLGTGTTATRRLPGGTLCHGPLLAIGRSVVYLGERRAIVRPLDLRARRSLGRADRLARSGRPGRVLLGITRTPLRTGVIEIREVEVASGRVTRRPGTTRRWPPGGAAEEPPGPNAPGIVSVDFAQL